MHILAHGAHLERSEREGVRLGRPPCAQGQREEQETRRGDHVIECTGRRPTGRSRHGAARALPTRGRTGVPGAVDG